LPKMKLLVLLSLALLSLAAVPADKITSLPGWQGVGTCAGGNMAERGDSMRIVTNFYYGHALISQQLYAQIIAACGDFSAPDVKCDNALIQMENAIGTFDVYNIYDECGTDTVTGAGPKLLDYFVKLGPGQPYVLKKFAKNPVETEGFESLGGALNDYPCGAETVMDTYLAQPSVIAALHVQTGGRQVYTKTAQNLLPLYKQLVTKFRVLIYSGDADSCVPYYGTEEWTYALGYNVTQAWRPWTCQYQTGHLGTAGYVTAFQSNWHFLTVKGAGHMVPQFQPAAGFAMIQRYLSNSNF